ncbi:ABC transporter ATP-binding protein [Phyllobacterium endophyticum]|uniref:ABC transporter ATP-binding protein n=1 Tax=Phyllobacterium endophyticum TaxID=1149773 RepID=A0A2P7B1V7_9HYPH|nr:ABC transporter ATP-binding protein [Phyllobacterium endophyticum]MBB3238032.1 ABC-type Fe3+/spermidine/putrescine transport system ATPase subunit [Phyllobacterium endophyticum]PSH60447.1 ABC transporter ATP-binding protein [Phyllobacterium endophyticum]TYR42626.1 ABC transporter ATP-binding protein [Phyllobacterium endophyticum]
MASLSIKSVSKTFANGMCVLDGINVDISSGEFVTLLGPSGCGKTTLLKAIAGFHPITSGQFLIDGKDITQLSPEQRNTAMCFQSYALFPHLTVSENILFGPRQKQVSKADCAARLATTLRQVDLESQAAKLPSALSGGQQQRVALGRAVAMRPGVILFDEPLSNLDAKLREQVRFEIRALQSEQGFTAIYVTHDQAEALAMSDRIVVLNTGRVEQIGTPLDLYHRPVNRFVADFIGAANILKADVVGRDGDGKWLIDTGLGRLAVSSATEPAASSIYVCWRPEDARFVANSSSTPNNTFSVRVLAQAFQGNVTDVFVEGAMGGPRYRVQTRGPLTIGSIQDFHVDPTHIAFLEAA